MNNPKKKARKQSHYHGTQKNKIPRNNFKEAKASYTKSTKHC
jgi:hypothetical protein